MYRTTSEGPRRAATSPDSLSATDGTHGCAASFLRITAAFGSGSGAGVTDNLSPPALLPSKVLFAPPTLSPFHSSLPFHPLPSFSSLSLALRLHLPPLPVFWGVGVRSRCASLAQCRGKGTQGFPLRKGGHGLRCQLCAANGPRSASSRGLTSGGLSQRRL